MSDDMVKKVEWLLKEGAQIIKDQSDEIQRLRGLMKSFIYQWEQDEIGKGNGTDYFHAVHAMQMVVRGE